MQIRYFYYFVFRLFNWPYLYNRHKKMFSFLANIMEKYERSMITNYCSHILNKKIVPAI